MRLTKRNNYLPKRNVMVYSIHNNPAKWVELYNIIWCSKWDEKCYKRQKIKLLYRSQIARIRGNERGQDDYQVASTRSLLTLRAEIINIIPYTYLHNDACIFFAVLYILILTIYRYSKYVYYTQLQTLNN